MHRRSSAPPPRPWQLAARRFFSTLAVVVILSTLLMVGLYVFQIFQLRQAWRADPPAPSATAPADGAGAEG